MKWWWGTKKQDSPVRGENWGVGTAEEIVSWDFWLDVSFQVQTAHNSFVRFAIGQLYPRQINPKHLEHTLISYFFSFRNLKEALQAQCYPLHQPHNSLQIRNISNYHAACLKKNLHSTSGECRSYHTSRSCIFLDLILSFVTSFMRNVCTCT